MAWDRLMVPREIVVDGDATVRRIPDLAVVSLAVAVTDKQAAKARDDVNRRSSAILEQLTGLGLPETDVQAASLVVRPTYDYGRGGPKVTGYEASRPMTLRIRNVELLGAVLDALVDDGATQVHGTSMELAEPEAATREALAAAVAVAQSRAEALAAAAGLTLGDPVSIVQGEGISSPIPRGAMLRAVAQDEAVRTEIATGEIEITAKVRVSFAIG
jgi:uncharacterized protein YggE